MTDKNYREVKSPQISARYLADYMAASERSRRTIVRNCKYQAIARVIQHDEAKAVVSNFIRSKNKNVNLLKARAAEIRGRLADSEFDQDLLDHNADYIERFANMFINLELPDVELFPASKSHMNLGGVKVTGDLQCGLRRKTKTNKIKIGAATLRYSKGKPLPIEVANWQSSFILGLLKDTNLDEMIEPENKLCLTIDAYSGLAHQAPTDSVNRFKNMEAACFSIAERWSHIDPP